MRWVFVFILVCGLFTLAFSQKFTLDIESSFVVTQDFGRALVLPYSGIGISYFYNNYNSSINYRSISWGSEISFGQGVRFMVIENKKIDLENINQLYLGVPLFYNKLSTSFGASSNLNIKFNKFRRLYLSIGMGYHINPSYRIISSKFQFFEGLIGLHIMLRS